MKSLDREFDVFNEAEYFQKYPDVGPAVELGLLQSAYEHYVNHGRPEGREFPTEKITLSHIRGLLRRNEALIQESRLCANFSRISQRYRKKNAVIFYTPHQFSGNLKYSFLEMVSGIRRGEVNTECYFLTVDQDLHTMLSEHGYPCLLWQGSGQNIVEKLLEAAVVVDDGAFIDGNPTPSLLYAYLSGARRVNLWHGTPLRNIFLQQLSGAPKIDLYYSIVLKSAVDNHIFCGSSKNNKNLFDSAMVIDDYKVTGYARNDIFYRETLSSDMLNVDPVLYRKISSLEKKEKTVLYAPTWREGRPDWIKDVDLAQLSRRLKESGIEFLINLHPFELNHNLNYLKSIPDLNFIDNKKDIYPLLKNVDLLLTDYSSIAFDYLHARRPILLLRPDHEWYLENNRGLIAEQVDVLKAPIVADVDSCVVQLIKMLSDPGPYIHSLTDCLHFSHDFLDGQSSVRCVDIISHEAERIHAAS